MGEHETVFTLEATPIKFGPGAVDDAGWELKRLGVTRALLVTDPGVAALGHPERVREAIEREGIEVVLYDRARVEPTLESFQDAADFARDAGVDGFVSVGGGSSIDTAKVADLITTHPAAVMDYVNPPVGEGRKPPSPLKPHLAIPTTSGTGAEATTVAVLDVPDQQGQDRHLAPLPAARAGRSSTPSCVRTLPAEVTSSTGLDVVCHAAESYLSKPYDARERPGVARRPAALPGRQPGRGRVVGQGPRVRRALPAPRGRGPGRPRGARRDDARRLDGGRRLRLGRRAHPARVRVSDRRAQARVRPPGYPDDHPFVPHGHSVIVTAPAAFRFTYEAAPERHHQVAELLSGGPIEDPGPDTLPDVLRQLMRDVGAPSGVAALGYTEDDVPRWSRARSSSSACSSSARARSAAEDLGHILNASMSWTAVAGNLVRPADRPLGRGLDAQPWQRAGLAGRRPVQVAGSVKAAPGMTLMTWGRSSSAVIYDRAAGRAPRLARSHSPVASGR